MRRRLDIDEDVLAAAEELAHLEGKSVGQVLSELARRGLERKGRPETRHGIELLPPRPEAGVVTSETVRRLLGEGW